MRTTTKVLLGVLAFTVVASLGLVIVDKSAEPPPECEPGSIAKSLTDCLGYDAELVGDGQLCFDSMDKRGRCSGESFEAPMYVSLDEAANLVKFLPDNLLERFLFDVGGNLCLPDSAVEHPTLVWNDWRLPRDYFGSLIKTQSVQNNPDHPIWKIVKLAADRRGSTLAQMVLSGQFSGGIAQRIDAGHSEDAAAFARDWSSFDRCNDWETSTRELGSAKPFALDGIHKALVQGDIGYAERIAASFDIKLSQNIFASALVAVYEKQFVQLSSEKLNFGYEKFLQVGKIVTTQELSELESRVNFDLVVQAEREALVQAATCGLFHDDMDTLKRVAWAMRDQPDANNLVASSVEQLSSNIVLRGRHFKQLHEWFQQVGVSAKQSPEINSALFYALSGELDILGDHPDSMDAVPYAVGEMGLDVHAQDINLPCPCRVEEENPLMQSFCWLRCQGGAEQVTGPFKWVPIALNK